MIFPMSGNTFGTLYCVTSFGESHGPAYGGVVDGCPPGLALAADDLQKELDRRKPGTSRHVTQRRETDTVEILSGVYEGRTTGTAIGFLIRNEDQRSKDYSAIAEKFRPGHADYTYWQKYGVRDPRGGGRASARETVVRVAAGAIAKKWLRERYGVSIRGYLAALGPIDDPVQVLGRRRGQPVLRAERRHRRRSSRNSWTSCARAATRAARGSTWSPQGVPVGWGEPVYGRLDADIAGAMMSINAVKGVEIGAGFAADRAERQRARRRDDAAGLPLQQQRRRARRHLDRPGRHGVDRAQADLEHPPAAAHDRHARARRPRSRPPAGTIPASASARRRSPRRCWPAS